MPLDAVLLRLQTTPAEQVCPCLKRPCSLGESSGGVMGSNPEDNFKILGRKSQAALYRNIDGLKGNIARENLTQNFK